MTTTAGTDTSPDIDVPRWLRMIMRSDRFGSSSYIVVSLLFAPILLLLDGWPVLHTIALVALALGGLWLGLLGIAMATGLAIVLRRGVELPEQYWKTVFDDYPVNDPGR